MRAPAHPPAADRPISLQRRLVVLITCFALAITGLTVLPQQVAPANAAGTPIVRGTIWSDAAGNGTLETTGKVGEVDKPLAGVPVDLICAATGAVLKTITTGADGTYLFGDGDLGSCTGDLRVRTSTASYAGNIYASEPASSANGFVRDSPTVGVSAPFTPAAGTVTTIDGLLKPTWALDLGLVKDPSGLKGDAVFTGTAPFDGSDTVDGQDSSASNNRVRSGDNVGFNWSITAQSADSLASSSQSVIFEQALTLQPGAVANFGSIPAICTGTNPATTLIALPSGTVVAPSTAPPAGTTSVVLSCNLGAMGDAKQAIVLATDVWVSPTSQNKSTFGTTARVYGVDGKAVPTWQPSKPTSVGPLEITSAPRYDLTKTFNSVYPGTRTINGSLVSGYRFKYVVAISTDRKMGAEAFTQPVTFEEDFWAQYTNLAGSNGPANSTVPGLKYYVTGCAPAIDGGLTGQAVLGKTGQGHDDYSVSNSGNCAYARTGDDASPYTMTLSGIDLTGVHYPTKTKNGASLAAGPYYVASYVIDVFIPNTEIDRTIGSDNDGVGSAALYNKVSGFGPVGGSGALNYGTGKEPGYCTTGAPASTSGAPSTGCDPMSTGIRSNNVVGPNVLTLNQGSWAKEIGIGRGPWQNEYDFYPDSVGYGDVLLQPGNKFTSRINITNSGSIPMTGIGYCDIFDNTTAKIIDLANYPRNTSGRPSIAGRYAAVFEGQTPQTQTANTSSFNYQVGIQDEFVVQYGVVNLSGDTSNNGVYNDNTDRYGGDWSRQSAAKCNDPAITWYDSLDAVPGGVDAVNAVKMTQKADSTYSLPSGGTLGMWMMFELRNTFNGGPNDGKSIPGGTIFANFGSITSNTLAKDWTSGRTWIPDPVNGARDGERVTFVRANMAISKRTVRVDGVGSGVADVGAVGTALAGDKVVWQVTPTVNATSDDPSPVDDVVITDVLPKYVAYDSSCTAGLSGGTPADSVTPNADGTTTLVWRLGSVRPNTSIPDRIICSDLDPLTPSRTSVQNSATITADDIVQLRRHTATHRVVVEQSGAVQLKKQVDRSLDLQNQDQKYTLTTKNFSDNLTIQVPTVLETFSYNGDATGPDGVNRSPKSAFSGTNQLTGPIQVTDGGGNAVSGTAYYTTVAPGSVPQDLNSDTDPSIWTTTVNDWSKVTGFKFVSTTNLAPASDANKSALVIKYTLKQDANKPGDWYANRFTAFSPSLISDGGAYQRLTSNQTNVKVVGFSLGDLIWIDNNGDGKFEPATDTPAPAGVKVEVWAENGTAPVASTTTNADGRWHVDNLPAGKYYVVVPASEFAAGGKLEGFAISPNGADSSVAKNEDEDQNAVADNGGMRSSGLVALTATESASTITGNGPTGDNVAGLRVPAGTSDDFTNFTVDLALKAVPGYTFTKTADPKTATPVPAGGTITYSLTGTNTGNTVLDPVKISDDLTSVLAHADLVPGSLKATIDGQATIAPTLDGKALSWTGKLTAGQKVVVSYQVTVQADAAGSTLKNKASSSATPPAGPEITPPPVETEHPVPGYAFAKSSDPKSGSAVAAGGTITYTLTGTNTGATTLDPVVVKDDLAKVLDNATLVSGSPKATVNGTAVTAPTLDGTTLSWTGSLKAGEKVEVSYQVKINDDAAGQTLTNSATSSATPPGIPPITPPPGTTEHPVPGYTFVKTADPKSGSAVPAGGKITYTLVGTNTGATVLDPVVITDDLSKVLNNAKLDGAPTATIDADPATAPTVAGTKLSWSGSLQPGQQVVITYTVTLDEAAIGQTLENTASSSATPPGLPPITPPPGTTDHPVPGFNFAKSADPASGKAVAVGGTITYTLVGKNTGATVLDPAVITDDLSKVLDHATLVDGSVKAQINGNDAAAPTLNGTTLTWSGALKVGETVTVTYQVKVKEGAEGATLTNTAKGEGTPPGLPPITPPPGTTEHPVPGYEFAKSSDPKSGSAVAAGGTITYTLTGTNTGATSLDPVVVKDDLAKVLDHATLVDGSLTAQVNGADVTAPTLVGTTLTWKGALKAGEKVEVRYQVKVNADAAGATLTNSATSEGTPPGLPPLTPPPGTTEHPVPGYEFAKSSDPKSGSAVNAGGTISYTLTGTNTGATVLDPVVITDDVSKVLDHADLVSGSLKATIGDQEATAPTLTGTTIRWTGKLDKGQKVTVTYQVQVHEDAQGATLTNSATSEGTPPELPPITPPPGTTEHPVPGYTFAKTSDPASGQGVVAGGTIGYTLVGTNTGATVLDPVVITDDLSKVLNNATLVEGSLQATISGAASPVAPKLEGTKLTWSGSLKAGQNVTVSYKVKLNANAAGAAIVNSATSEGTPPGLPPITPPGGQTEHPVPGYEFTKTSDPGNGQAVPAGGQVTYTLVGTNTGATVLDPVVVTDDLSKVLDHADLVGDPVAKIGGEDATAPTLDGTKLSWSGSLKQGESVAISYIVKVKADAQGQTLTNKATSEGTPPGLPPVTPPPGVTEHPVPGYEFSKAADPASETAVQPGEVISYTLSGKNTGATVLDPVVIDDDLGKVLDHADLVEGSLKSSVGAAPKLDGAKLTWSGKLEPGQTVTVTYQVKVKADAWNAVIRNLATSSATPPGLPPITPPPGETWHPTPGFSVMKEADPASGSTVKPGSTIGYTVTGSNTGQTDLDPVVITDDLGSVLPYAELDAGSLKATVGDKAVDAPKLDGTKLTWTGTLAKGEKVTITYSVKVKAVEVSGGKTLKNKVVGTATPPTGKPITPGEIVTEHRVPEAPKPPAPSPSTPVEPPVNPEPPTKLPDTGA